MALAAAYGRPPEPRYEQPAPTYGDPGPYRAQEPLPSQLARPAKKKRPRRKHGELARGIVRRREDWDDHCLIEMDDGFVSCVCQLQGAFNSTRCGALCGRRAARALPAAARWRRRGAGVNWRPRGTGARRGTVAAPSFLRRCRLDGVAVVRRWRHRRAVVPAAASARRRGHLWSPRSTPSCRQRDGVNGLLDAINAKSFLRRRRRDVVASMASRWPCGRLDGVEVDAPSRCRRRQHTHKVAAAARATAAPRKQKHVPLTGSRTSSATATAARASNYPSKVKWWTSSST